MPRREMTNLEALVGDQVYDAIQHASNTTARSQQQQDFRLGVSNIGHCRQYATLLVRQTPPTEVRDKTAAFIGTVLGAAIEDALAELHPDWLFQHETVFHLPGGGELAGHPDVVIPYAAQREDWQPQGVLDLKSKAELETVRRLGQTQQQQFQLHAYAAALIEDGILNPDEPIWLADVYYDRSGAEPHPYVVGEWYNPDVITHMDQWVEDVKYAVIHGEDASRDQSREFCWAWCEYATACRGNDTDVEGLIEDPTALAAVEAYLEARDMENASKRIKTRAQIALNGIRGTTGQHTVRWVEIGASEFTVRREPYLRLDIRPVPRPKQRKEQPDGSE